jgi:hypothetical protein
MASTTVVSSSRTMYFVPSTSVMTVSGVLSTRSIRSEFRANTEPERRVSVITGAPSLCV